VAAGDLAGDAMPHRPLQWLQVAAHAFPELATVSKAKRARKAGHLLLNGQSRVPTLACAAVGDVLTYLSPERQTQQLPTAEVEDPRARSWLKTCRTQGLRLVYESDSVAVVVKPVGIHVKGRGPRTVERALPLLLQRPQCIEAGDAELPVPHAVHRLDYRVGGLLLVAKSRRMEVELAAQLESHSVTKQYRAILVGDVLEKVATSGGGVDAVQLPKALQEIRGELQFMDDPIDGRPCLTAMRVVSTTRRFVVDWCCVGCLRSRGHQTHRLRVWLSDAVRATSGSQRWICGRSRDASTNCVFTRRAADTRSLATTCITLPSTALVTRRKKAMTPAVRSLTRRLCAAWGSSCIRSAWRSMTRGATDAAFGLMNRTSSLASGTSAT